MVGSSVCSFISKDFVFVKCVRVISISPSSPMTACEFHWQEIVYWFLPAPYPIPDPDPQLLLFWGLSQNLTPTLEVLSQYHVDCIRLSSKTTWELQVYTLLSKNSRTSEPPHSMSNETTNSSLCATFKNHKCTIHRVDLIHSNILLMAL